MGKKKIREKKEGFDTEFSLSTIRVANLPYTFTKSQLEETFSDVGPVRRCFMVTEKGSTDHRGCAIVQFAITEDAKRAIELKNGSSVGGRKIRIKQAQHRAPLEQRRSNTSQAVQSDDTKATSENDKSDEPKETLDMLKSVQSDNIHKKDENKKVNKVKEAPDTPKIAQPDDTKTKKKNEKSDKPKEFTDEPKEENQKKPPKVKKDSKDSADSKGGSEKQRVARTVIYGGLLNGDMAEDIHRRAREIGSVSSFTYPLPKDELEHNGLAQEGCKMSAAAIVFTSVTSARASVAMLHQKEIRGAKIWARQLGGEGAKAQKWKLIVRNLPFQAKANEIRDLFLSAGFVWDVYMPPSPTTGLSKGFAFVKFTCKQDAEKAIKKFNGQMFLKRTIAVDWTVPKKLYASGDNPTVATEDGQQSDSDLGSICSDGGMEDDVADTVRMEEDSNTVKNLSKETLTNEIEETPPEVDFDEEADVARKVIQNLLSSSCKGSVNNDSTLPKKKEEKLDETVHKHKKPSVDPSKEVIDTTETGKLNKSKVRNVKPADGEEDLHKEIFIRNLPFEVDKEEVKQRFLAFGEVLTFIPCLHKVTKRPKGTGFLKFKSPDAADAAVAAADVNSDLGIFLKGRQLTVLKTLNKESAREKELEKAKPVDTDHRNLYLAKEGLIPEGSSVADQISASDMSKRKSLQTIKEIKLQSPNFHVSKTSLILYNVPKSMSEKELRKICIDAVTSRATKQKPVIRQIKFLKDKKNTEKGKASAKDHSRGVAFVEFTEHEHAIVALRTLNNNPETFGSEHRPIVEFALDNVQKLKQRKDQATFNELNVQRNNIPKTPDGRFNKDENTRKRKTEGSSKSNQVGGTENKVPNEALTENHRPGKKLKSRNQFTPKETSEASQNIPERHRKDKKSNTEKSPQKPFAQPQKRKLQDWTQQPSNDKSSLEGKKRKKKTQPGEALVDKLDVLIQKYQTKFSQPSSNKAGGDNKQQGSKQLRRWYQT